MNLNPHYRNAVDIAGALSPTLPTVRQTKWETK
jgi:hypothetical protein